MLSDISDFYCAAVEASASDLLHMSVYLMCLSFP